MKVLQINAVYKTKSTGRIAWELHKYFQKSGITSYVAYGTENTDVSGDPNVFRIGNVLDHKIHAVQYRIDNLQGCHSTLATKMLIEKVKKIKPDIVLTHNLHSNYLNVPLLFRELHYLGIAIVLVLHDCWFLTGGCYHYTSLGCDKWLYGCKNCSMLGSAAEKKYSMNCNIMDEVHPTVIASSKWIEREARKSLLGSRSDIRMIYNWIDMGSFYPRDSHMIREKHNAQGKTVILGVAADWSPEKGQNEIIEIAKSFPDALIIIVGNQLVHIDYPENVKYIEFTDSKDELAELYSVADLFFNPSKQETFGLTCGEALACGTPIVVYNTTACPEFVTEYTGVSMEKGSDLVSAVNEMLIKNNNYGRDVIKERCCKFVDDNFNMEKNIGKYIELLDELVNH